MSLGSDVPEHLQRLLRLLTIGDETTLDQALRGLDLGLDPKTQGLVTIAALVATEGEGPSYQIAIDQAHLDGAGDAEILQTLVTIAPMVGGARIASALPELRAALVGEESQPFEGPA
jgi:alkylhydroperoxidase/carboxymuconolactone decarboxylase family protein YurZ